jgi:uncharacterized protein YecT (DUF1311 family)
MGWCRFLCLIVVVPFGSAMSEPPARAIQPAPPVPQDASRMAFTRTEADMVTCRERARRAADRDLNAVYQRLLVAKRDETKYVAALRTSERAWIAFRDAQCTVDTWDSRGGTAFGVYVDSCVTTMTRQRIAALTAIVAAP